MRRAIHLMVFAALLVASTEAAASATCSGPELRVEGLDPSWSAEMSTVRRALQRRADVDRCAQILVSRSRSGATVTVTLADGRAGSRFVDGPADLLATVEALALLPPVVEAEPEPVKAPPTESPRPEAPPPPGWPSFRVNEAGTDDAPANGAGRSRSTPRFDLGASLGSRWSGGPGGSAAVLGELSLGPWIVGMDARWEGYEGPAQSDVLMVQTVGVGAEFGYRVDLGRLGIAALLEPNIDALAQEPRYGSPTPVSVRDARVARLGGELRCTFLSEQRLRLFASLDGAFDVITDQANQPGLLATTPALPTWSAGLSVGAQFRAWP